MIKQYSFFIWTSFVVLSIFVVEFFAVRQFALHVAKENILLQISLLVGVTQLVFRSTYMSLFLILLILLFTKKFMTVQLAKNLKALVLLIVLIAIVFELSFYV